MLNHISPVFSPELLAAVYAMGHGDTIVLADGNFPSDGVSRRGAAEIIRADGHGIPELLDGAHAAGHLRRKAGAVHGKVRV